MPQRRFLTWHSPLLPQVADSIAGDPEGRLLDLSASMVVTPSAEAGRLLRECLAVRAADRGSALLAPILATPDAIGRPAPDAASPAASLAAWMLVLTDLPLDRFRAVFPADPPQRDAAWALHAAAQFLTLRRTLEEGGLDIAGAAHRLGPDHEEAARWQELAAIETMAQRTLAAAGLADPLASRRAAPPPPEGIVRIVVASMPDLPPLVAGTLTQWEQSGLAVDVLVHAPADMAASFDAWGRPLPDAWRDRVIELPGGDAAIHVVDRPDDAAEFLHDAWVRSPLGDPPALASTDPEVTAALIHGAHALPAGAWDPSGIPLSTHAIHWVLELVRDLVRDSSLTAAGHLLRLPGIAGLIPSRPARTAMLWVWDAFIMERLPADLDIAAQLAREAQAAEAAAEKPTTDDRRDPAAKAANVLDWLTGLVQHWRAAADLDPILSFFNDLFGREHSAVMADAARLVVDAVAQVEDALAAIPLSADTGTRLDLVLHLVRHARLTPPPPPGAEPVSGWLELPWIDAPHLVIAGCNDGLLPESVVGDPWLPDGARARLGLRSNDSRLVRDAFLLAGLAACRPQRGALDLVCCRTDASGDPLKPSRLLFRCPDKDLPRRALALFAESSSDGASRRRPHRERAWPLKVPAPRPGDPVFSSISVTHFGDYLACPFRFYLKHALKMRPFEAHPVELDPRGYGNAVHHAIERLHLDPDLRDCIDERRVAAFLTDALHAWFAVRHGPRLTLPLLMQRDSASRRLTAFASVHAASRREGWRTLHTEVQFPDLKEGTAPIAIDGMKVNGRIDLIEERLDAGRRSLRIVDYKTGKDTTAPEKHHLKKLSDSDTVPPWQRVDYKGKPHRWTSLQLAYYASVVSRVFDCEDVGAAYITVAPAASDTMIRVFDDLDHDVRRSAEACAAGIVRAIRSAIFWPPAESVAYEEFADLAPDGIAVAFDGSALEKYRTTIAAS